MNSVVISDDSEEEAIVVQEVEAIIEDRNGNRDVEMEADHTSQDKAESNIKESLEEIGQMENDIDSLNTKADKEENIEIDNEKSVENMNNKVEENSDAKVLAIEQVHNDNIQDKESIHEAKTQIPLNASTDTLDDEETPLSMEVAYDYPNTGREKVTILEKTDDENLPSTNDTDDIQITCGQDVKDLQSEESNKMIEGLEQTVEKNNENEKDESVPLENGIDEVVEKEIENGQTEIVKCVDVSIKAVDNEEELTVEDMLADFVDEVNEEKNVAA